MAYDEFLADRVKNVLKEKRVPFEARKMMGGLCFMVDNKMCCAIIKDCLMARIGTEIYQEALTKEGCNEMDFTGRPMKGYVFIHPDGMDMDVDLDYWIQLCIDFNPYAKASKKKTPKKKK